MSATLSMADRLSWTQQPFLLLFFSIFILLKRLKCKLQKRGKYAKAK